ncbi:MAG: glycosyltransferase [Ilumatobacteraceae bacterium]
MRSQALAASVVIPAHNEERGLRRLLEQLDVALPGLEVVVVCNGCTDRTSETARSFGPNVTVVDLPDPSKAAALKEGDRVASAFPRLYVDADVEIDRTSVDLLVSALESGTTLAAGPRRILPRAGVGLVVRWYYDVWEQLPQVRAGLFGRGVIAVTAEGFQRVQNLPQLMSDDLVISEAFAPAERTIVDAATVTVWPPRTVRALLRRRTRVATGNVEAEAAQQRTREAKTTVLSLIDLCRTQPRITARMPVFLAVTVVARLAARRNVGKQDFTTWLRDDTSRM